MGSLLGKDRRAGAYRDDWSSVRGAEAMVGGGILTTPAISDDDGGVLQRGEKEGVRFTRENRAATHGGNGSPNEVDDGGSRD
jgi:hypothetical protein